jgi:hypothetical protein
MDQRPETDPRDDGAIFAPTRIRAPGRPPIVPLALALAVSTLIVLGSIEGLRGDRSSAPDGQATGAAPDLAQAARTPRPTRAPGATLVPPQRLSPDILELDLRPAGGDLFVHGEVFSLSVVVVIVSIEDNLGHASDVQSVKLQGGSTAFRLGPNARFDVRFEVPEEDMGEGLWVQANGYDFRGRIIESVRQPVIFVALAATDAERPLAHA